MIPEGAVEAAAKACAKDEDASSWDDEPEYYRNGWLGRMDTALEAAAPHLMAQALEEAAAEWPNHQAAHMGKGTVQQISVWLSVRAAIMRGDN